MTSIDFIIVLKDQLFQDFNENLTLHMIQRYPQLLMYSQEFLKQSSPNSLLAHFLETYEKQKYMGSGLFRHCLICQYKTKVIDVENWACSNPRCKEHKLR
jgi:hypothetical protein